MKKASSGSTGKSENIGKTGVSGKSGITVKNTVGNSAKPTPKVNSSLPSVGKLPSVSSPSTKDYGLSSFQPQKKSTTFGIIWLPGRKKNKYKDEVYNSHKNDRSHDRAPSMYNYMSGDSSSHQTFLKKREEETDLVPGRSGTMPIAIAGAGSVAPEMPDIANKNPEENQEFIKQDKDEGKEAAGDANDSIKSSDKEYLENNEKDLSKSEKTKMADNVDSVFLRSPPPHKTRSNTSTNNEEEDCGIKCLYYTLQCCDCVLM